MDKDTLNIVKDKIWNERYFNYYCFDIVSYGTAGRYLNHIDNGFDYYVNIFTGTVYDYNHNHVKHLDWSEEHAAEQAESKLETIKEKIDSLETEDPEDADSIEEEIMEMPLEIGTGYSYWLNPENTGPPDRYMILLCTGGPAVRIVGDLDEYSEPETAQLQYQDWFTPWNTYSVEQEDEYYLIEFARKFMM